MHSSRHTFATQALAMGVDIYTVSQLLGHTHISTTQVYVHSLLQKKQEAIRLIAGMAA
ncbi:tyrosine-type recombinase/integrase [Segatella sp.]